MPKIIHVARAQQRYATKPVLDPTTGEQKRTPVMSTKTGEQKRSKRGVPQFLSVTERDLDHPLPMPECDFALCSKPERSIAPGESYKHITTKTTYGSTTRNRHETCPNWHVWEYSQSLNARLAQITYDYTVAIEQADNPDDITQALDEAASAIEEIAEEKSESASNIEDGFGHPTQASEELQEISDALTTWAEEVRDAEVLDLPEPEERWFVLNAAGERDERNDEEGYEDEDDAQAALDAWGEDEPEVAFDGYTLSEETADEPTFEQVEDWLSEVTEATCAIVDEVPV